MATIAHRFLKLEPMINKSTARNHVFFIAITFIRTDSFAYINSYVNISLSIYQNLNVHQFQNDFHQDNLPIACL